MSVLRFRVADYFERKDPLTVPLLRLMAATNDARLVMTQIIRGQRGGRKPRNSAEMALAAGEQLYLVRMLCGHLFEAGSAFRGLWQKRHSKKVKRCLETGMALDPASRKRLEVVVRELVDPPTGGLWGRVLEPIRNHWAFHYFDQDYRDALELAEEESRVLIADTRGRSRYLIIDDFVTRAMLKASGKTREDYERDVKSIVELAGGLGRIVDAMILGLLHEKGADSFSRQDLVLRMDRGLARGWRDAKARWRIDRPRG